MLNGISSITNFKVKTVISQFIIPFYKIHASPIDFELNHSSRINHEGFLPLYCEFLGDVGDTLQIILVFERLSKFPFLMQL